MGSADIARSFLTFGTGRRWVVSFALWLLYHRGKSFGTHSTEGSAGPNAVAKGKIPVCAGNRTSADEPLVKSLYWVHFTPRFVGHVYTNVAQGIVAIQCVPTIYTSCVIAAMWSAFSGVTKSGDPRHGWYGLWGKVPEAAVPPGGEAWGLTQSVGTIKWRVDVGCDQQ
jgi:hypothetical protein